MIALRSMAGPRWALVAAAPAPFALIGWWHGRAALMAAPQTILLAAIAALALAAAGLALERRPTFARTLAALGLMTLLLAAGPALIASPALALLLSVVVVIALLLLHARSRVQLAPSPAPTTPAEVEARGARAAGITACILWLLTTFAGPLTHNDSLGLAALAVSQIVAATLLVLWSVSHFRAHRVRALVLALVIVALVLFVAIDGLTWVSLVDAVASFVVIGLVVLSGIETSSGPTWLEPIVGHPARLMVATFALLCTVGTVLLALPRMSTSGVGLPLEDAAFTAVSGVCVTGLSVIDIGQRLTPLGQATLLLLIQAGGLGIMTFSTAAIRMLGRRLSLRHEGAMARLVSPEDRSRVFASTRAILRYTLLVEGVGAIVLWLGFVNAGHDPVDAIWTAVFTSVSAFCNAGFALASDSLVGVNGEPIILHGIALLIILGGLSPAVVAAIPAWTRRRPIAAQARLALLTTGALLVVAFFAYLGLEWSKTLDGMSFMDRINNAWFQAVTVRTGGFNSVDLTLASSATLLVLMALMLIGGSPGGTGGGLKTTTLAVLVLGLIATVRGRDGIDVPGRRVTLRSFAKAVAVVLLFVGLAFAAVIALLVTQDMAPRVGAFEAVSALSTTGLTIGGTMGLDAVGRGIIMGCMFVGRLGPLTLLLFMSQERHLQDPWRRPETDIEVA